MLEVSFCSSELLSDREQRVRLNGKISESFLRLQESLRIAFCGRCSLYCTPPSSSTFLEGI